MPTVIDCPKAAERDLASLYLAGKLSREEAEAFEEHFFSCENCRRDVAAGSELRELFGKTAVVPESRPDHGRSTWLPLAAAAAFALIGFGVWRLSRPGVVETAPSGLRSTGAALVVRVDSAPGGGFALSWAAPPGAASYAVEVFGSDGASLWHAESAEPRAVVGPERLSRAAGGGPAMAVVEAFDVLHQPVAKSAPAPLVPAGSKP